MYALGNECSQCKNFLCSTKGSSRRLIYKVKPMGELEKLVTSSSSGEIRTSNLSNPF